MRRVFFASSAHFRFVGDDVRASIETPASIRGAPNLDASGAKVENSGDVEVGGVN